MDKYIKFGAVMEYLRNRSDEARKCGHEETYFDLLTIIDGLKNMETVPASALDKDTNVPTWIPVSERLPACEQEVLICTKVKPVGKDAYIDSIITPAIYEDGTMTENDSAWGWEEVDWAGWDEEEDCGIIPEGWWENRHFNPDNLFNCPVDREVVAWMPLPQPYKEG